MRFRDFYAQKTGLRPGQWGNQDDELLPLVENMIDLAAEYLIGLPRDRRQEDRRRVNDRRQAAAWPQRGPDRRSAR